MMLLLMRIGTMRQCAPPLPALQLLGRTRRLRARPRPSQETPFAMIAASEIFSMEMSKTEALTQVDLGLEHVLRHGTGAGSCAVWLLPPDGCQTCCFPAPASPRLLPFPSMQAFRKAIGVKIKEDSEVRVKAG